MAGSRLNMHSGDWRDAGPGPIQPSLEKTSCINILSRFNSKFAHQERFLILSLLLVRVTVVIPSPLGLRAGLSSPDSSKSLQYLCKVNLKSFDNLQLHRLAE